MVDMSCELGKLLWFDEMNGFGENGFFE